MSFSTEPIRFSCDGCDKQIKVAAASAGKRGKCPQCNAPITVPDPQADDLVEEQEASWIDDLPKVQSRSSQSQPKGKTGWENKPILVRALFVDEWAGVATFGFVTIWILVFLRIFGLDILDLVSRRSSSSPLSLVGYFYLALGFSAILIPLGLLRTWRSYVILSRGVEVPGTIVKEGTGFISSSGASGKKVTIGYEFEGKSYTVAITDRLFKKIEEKFGAKPKRFIVIVDPQKPKRALVDERTID
jgi:hypothetical protein